MTCLIDTAKAIRRIEDAGIAHKQAEAIVETFADAIEQLATKADIENPRTTTKADNDDLRTSIDNLRTSIDNLRTDIENLRTEMNAKFESVKYFLLVGSVASQVAGMGLLFGLIKFFG